VISEHEFVVGTRMMLPALGVEGILGRVPGPFPNAALTMAARFAWRTALGGGISTGPA